MALKKRKAKKKAARKPASRRRATKRKPQKRTVARKAAKKKLARAGRAVVKKAKEDIVGVVTHYFPQVRAAVVKLKAPLVTGQRVRIKGHTTDFEQSITSMQINHVPVDTAKKGQEIGVLVDSRVRQHDVVLKLK